MRATNDCNEFPAAETRHQLERIVEGSDDVPGAMHDDRGDIGLEAPSKRIPHIDFPRGTDLFVPGVVYRDERLRGIVLE